MRRLERLKSNMQKVLFGVALGLAGDLLKDRFIGALNRLIDAHLGGIIQPFALWVVNSPYGVTVLLMIALILALAIHAWYLGSFDKSLESAPIISTSSPHVSPSTRGAEPDAPQSLAPKPPATPNADYSKAIEGKPLPNVVCLGAKIGTVGYDEDSDVWKRDGEIPAAIAIFRNQPNPPQKTPTATNLIAEILFYQRDGTHSLLHVTSGVWIENPYASADLPPARTLELILAVPVQDGMIAIENPRFEAVRYSEDATRQTPVKGQQFDVKVTISGGYHSELSFEYYFEIDIAPENKVKLATRIF